MTVFHTCQHLRTALTVSERLEKSLERHIIAKSICNTLCAVSCNAYSYSVQGRSQHGARGGGAIAPQSWAVPPQSGLAPATVVSLRLAMGQLRLEKCIKPKTIQ